MARPRGIWSDKPWREAIRKAVSRRTEDGGKSIDRLALELVRKATTGDVSALIEIGNRLDGKAHQSTDIVISDERMVVNAPQPEQDADEWAQKNRPH